MTKRWKIRRALDSDASELGRCMHAAYQTYADRIDPKELPPMNVNYEIEIRESEVWIAELESRLVGALVLSGTKGAFKVANIAVHPEFQGNGLGRGLMDFAEREAIRRGFVEMNLATHPLLKENVSMYLHLGWKESFRNESQVQMKKLIDDSPKESEKVELGDPD